MRRLTICCLLAVASAGRLAAQDVGPQLPVNPFNQGPFRFPGEARQVLQRLWQASVDMRQERVACIGGYQRNGVTYITRAEPLPASHAGLRSIAADESLQRCRPPDWFGTVHTHVVTFSGHAYVTFSANDRQVMFLWRRTWQIEGVFCVLYSGQQAHCEGASNMSGEPLYAYPRGNRIGILR
ncbi:MAG: hypothetical protein ACREMW_04735 [Gemmatimonadales bacterium]